MYPLVAIFLFIVTCFGQIQPFHINISNDIIGRLRVKLELTNFPDQLTDIPWNDWSYGMPLDYTRELVTYWSKSYNWRVQEKNLNRFNQFKVKIDDLNIHFIHQRSTRPDATPLLIVHGWPGSFMECYKAIDSLIDPNNLDVEAFHVICPSLPGYGFSDAPKKQGFGPKSIAKIFIKLMQLLKYDTYIAQGGDWGSLITTYIAALDKEHVLGLHINMVAGGPPLKKGLWPLFKTVLSFIFPKYFFEENNNPFLKSLKYLTEEGGYYHQQSTRPQTLGYALNDSPVGLLTWIVDKFYSWSDNRGADDQISRTVDWLTKDELLNNVMIYYVTNSITSSMRLYYEFSHNEVYTFGDLYIDVPTAVVNYPNEIISVPRSWAEYTYNIQRWTNYNKGGHFALLEQTETLVSDVRLFARQLYRKQSKTKISHSEL